MHQKLEPRATGKLGVREKLHRKFPELTEEAVEEKLRQWLRTRPGAEHGDSAGKPISLPK